MERRNRIAAGDTIKAKGFNKKGEHLCTVYDSGFTTTMAVIRAVKDAHWGKGFVAYVEITNESKSWSDYYYVHGKRKI